MAQGFPDFRDFNNFFGNILCDLKRLSFYRTGISRFP